MKVSTISNYYNNSFDYFNIANTAIIYKLHLITQYSLYGKKRYFSYIPIAY